MEIAELMVQERYEYLISDIRETIFILLAKIQLAWIYNVMNSSRLPLIKSQFRLQQTDMVKIDIKYPTAAISN